MKNRILFFVCVVLGTPAMAQDIQEIKAKSAISRVIVYLDGAQVFREATVNLKAGKNQLVFSGLSPQVNTKSIQVSGDEALSVLSITSHIDYLNHEEDKPKIRVLRDSLELLNDKIAAVNDNKDAFNTEKQMLLKNQSIGGQNNGVSVADLKLAADYYRSRIRDINSELTRLTRQYGEYNRIVQRLQQQLNDMNARQSYRRGEVSVLVTSTRAMTTKITLNYLIREAGWVPVYDIKAAEINKPIQLIYRAKVFNDSEIDWKDAALTLSTADPNQSASKPSLEPWYLNYRSQGLAYQKGLRLGISSREKSAAYPSAADDGYLDMEAVEYDKSNRPQVRKDQIQMLANQGEQKGQIVEIADLNIEFDIKEKYSIPADAHPYMVDVGKYDLQATYKHYAAPKVEKTAFLLARVTGWESLNLVSGFANIYFDGTYLGQSMINTAEISDTLDISLGRDNKVIVTREIQKEFTSKKLIGTNRKESYGYEIQVKNNRNTAIDIEVLDQAPVSQDSEIEVTKQEVSGAEQNELTGELKWKMQLAPAEAKKMVFAFAIKYPKSKPVNVTKAKYRNMRYL